jgi:hypothetical protein
MSRKTWGTISEETLVRGVAAFNFLRAYTLDDLSSEGVRVAHGKLTKYAVGLQVLQLKPADAAVPEYTGFCLSNSQWGALFWPVCIFQDGDITGYFLDPAAEVHWVFMLKPQDWQVVCTKATLVGDRIVMIPTDTVPILKYYFGNTSHQNQLTVADLILLAEVMNLNKEDFNPKKLLRVEMVHCLLDKISPEDHEWIDKVKASMKKPQAQKTIGDCLDEFILSEMPLEEQRDFKEVAEEVQTRQKAGWTLVDQKFRQQREKKKAKPKRKPKAKAKPAAKPEPKAKSGKFGRKRKRMDGDGPDLGPEKGRESHGEAAPRLIDTRASNRPMICLSTLLTL